MSTPLTAEQEAAVNQSGEEELQKAGEVSQSSNLQRSQPG